LLLSPTLALGTTLMLSLLLAGCAGSGRHPSAPAGGSSTAKSGSAGSSTPPCRQWSCAPQPLVQLGAGYSVRLWSSATPSSALSPDRSTPVLELLRDGQHLQWWAGQSGFGWTAKLTCLPAGASSLAHCAVLSEVGSHAGIGELVLLSSGALTSPAQASVSFDGGRPTAADLDQDGWLDLIGTENDYQPNYATGHNFWATYRFADGALLRTGCAPRPTATAPPPDRLLTGDCPVLSAN